MTTEPNYTDAQIEQAALYIQINQPLSNVSSMLRQLLSERQAAMQGQGGEVVDRVAKAIADAAGHGMREKCEHMAHAAIAAYQLATWNPVRSVSDEDVDGALDAYEDSAGPTCISPLRVPMRAALEHFAAIAQEKQS